MLAAPLLPSASPLLLPVESPPFRRSDVLPGVLDAGVGWRGFVVEWQLGDAEPETR